MASNTDRERHDEIMAELSDAVVAFNMLAAEMQEHMAILQQAIGRMTEAVAALRFTPGIGYPGTSSYEER